MAADPAPEPEPEPEPTTTEHGGRPGTSLVLWVPPPAGRAKGQGGRIHASDRARIDARRVYVAAGLFSRKSYRKMAEECSVSPGTISDDVAAIRKQWQERAAEQYDVLVAEEVAKLDAVEAAWFATATDPAADVQAAAVATVILDRVARHRARLLGLDYRKPIEKPEGSRASVEALRAEALMLVDEFTQRRLRAAEAATEAAERARRLSHGLPDDDEMDDG